MNYLVLGSSGVIGRALTAHLKDNGHTVIEFDILNSPGEDLRITDNRLLIKYIQQVDFVYFLAYDVGGSKYLQQHQSSIRYNTNNLKILANTFDVLEEYKVPFIFASSQMSNMPDSTYGLTKLIGEKLTNALNGVVVKFWNVYGPEDDEEKAHVITDFINSAKTKNIIAMKTNGQEQRQFLHTDDCARALYILSHRYNLLDRNRPYHITSFEWTSIRDLAYIIADLIGNTQVVVGSDTDTIQGGIVNQPDEYILNFWQPCINLRDGVLKLL